MSAGSPPAASAPLSYCGPAVDPANLLASWNLDPLLLASVIAGLSFAARLSGQGRLEEAKGIAWAAAAVFLLYISPFCAWGSSLFTVRVVHHLLLALLLAPLLARLAEPALRRIPGGMAAWTVTASTVLWAWHAPRLYDWAVSSDAAYWLMQLSIVATATLFWHRIRNAERTSAIFGLLGAMVAMGALGAIITLAELPLYEAHFSTTAAWGISPLDDQQLAGLVMWAPASAVYLVAALAHVRRLVGQEALG